MLFLIIIFYIFAFLYYYDLYFLLYCVLRFYPRLFHERTCVQVATPLWMSLIRLQVTRR